MIARLLIALLTLLPLAHSLEAGVWDRMKSAFLLQAKPKPPTIKVLIAHNLDSAMIEVTGQYNIYDPYKNARVGTRFSGKRAIMQPLNEGLKWGEEFPGVYQVQLVPDFPHTTTIINGKEYRGKIYVYDVGGAISIVNEVDIEEYLSSTLAPEAELQHSDEALAAAFIAARTDAYHRIVHGQNPFWHVDANQAGYQGYSPDHYANGLARALAATRYMVMSRPNMYEEGINPFPTRLVGQGDASCGKTARNQLSLEEAEMMAKRGEHAARILSKAFPNTSIELIYQPQEQPRAVAEGRGPPKRRSIGAQ